MDNNRRICQAPSSTETEHNRSSVKPNPMVAPLDIFAVQGRGQTKWLGCAQTLAKALELALKHGQGTYFVFSVETGHKNFYEVTEGGTINRVVS